MAKTPNKKEGLEEKPRPRAKERACDEAIRKTLAYSAIFKYPMSSQQIYNYLISDQKFKPQFFNKSLKRLVKKKHIRARNAKYYMPGIRPVSWKLRQGYSKELLKITEKAAKLLKNVPWIKLFGITGAVAAYNAVKNDDIDVIIITQKNRVWITRAFVFLILKITSLYAQGKDRNQKICCNLFVDEGAMKWNEEKQNIYIAREIIGMIPLINREDTYHKFLKENEWVFDHFKNFKVEFPKKLTKSKDASRFVDLLENTARNMQLKFMSSKKTTEITTSTLIHFNKYDHANKIIKEYLANIENIE